MFRRPSKICESSYESLPYHWLRGIEREDTRVDGIEVQWISQSCKKSLRHTRLRRFQRRIDGSVASAFASLGTQVISIVPRWLEREGLTVYQGAEPIYCNDLAERKHLMLRRPTPSFVIPAGSALGTSCSTCLPAVRSSPSWFVRLSISTTPEDVASPLMLQMETAVEAGLLQPQVFARVHSFETADALEESLAKEYPKGGAKVRDSESGLPERSRRPAVAD